MRGTGNRVKKKSKPPDHTEQSQRFVETARKLDVDETGKAFEKVLKVLKLKKDKKSKYK